MGVSIENDLDQLSLLERAAHTALYLLQELKASTEKVAQWTTTSTGNSSTKDATNNSSSLEPIERPQFILKLAPRIRRLESDTLLCLTRRLEDGLTQFQQHQQQKQAKLQQDLADEKEQAQSQQQQHQPSSQHDSTEKVKQTGGVLTT